MGISDENSQVLPPAIYGIQSIRDGSALTEKLWCDAGRK